MSKCPLDRLRIVRGIRSYLILERLGNGCDTTLYHDNKLVGHLCQLCNAPARLQHDNARRQGRRPGPPVGRGHMSTLPRIRARRCFGTRSALSGPPPHLHLIGMCHSNGLRIQLAQDRRLTRQSPAPLDHFPWHRSVLASAHKPIATTVGSDTHHTLRIPFLLQANKAPYTAPRRPPTPDATDFSVAPTPLRRPAGQRDDH